MLLFNKKTVVTVHSTVSFPEIGHWADEPVFDSCTGVQIGTQRVWKIDSYDYTKATVVAANVKVVDINNVSVSIKDVSGNISTAQWTFNSISAPLVSEMSPTDGSVQKFVPRITAKFTDNSGIDASSIILKLDSVVVPHIFTPATGVVLYSLSEPLTAGLHNCSLEVKDNYGNLQTAVWSFTVQTDTNSPVISGLSPAMNGVVATAFPSFSFTASDSDGINKASVRVVVNGQEVNNFTVTNAAVGQYVDVTKYSSCGQPYTAQEWVVTGYDPNKVTVKLDFSNLPDVNRIYAMISDNLGNTSVVYTKFSTSQGPAIGQCSLANSWTLNDKPTISAQITDNGVIESSSIELKVDGSKVDHIYIPSGSSAGTVSYVPSVPLTNAVHSVFLSVYDSLGNTSTQSWSFGVGPGLASFSNPAPAAGSTFTVNDPEISIPVSDVKDIKTVTMSVNGKPVTATMNYNQKGHYVDETRYSSCGEPYTVQVWVFESWIYNSGSITYKPTSLPDGNNTVEVAVTNAFGGVSKYSWSFIGKVPPVINRVYPQNGSIINKRNPEISATLIDNSKVASYKMLLDGVQVNAIFDPVANKLSYTPGKEFPNTSDHVVQFIATGAEGLTTTVTSKFHVETMNPMPYQTDYGTCTSCHAGFPTYHPMGNCDACHNGQLLYGVGHEYGCGECHGPHSNGDVLNTRRCIDCHFPWSPPHAESPAHISSADMRLCGDCHTPDLTREHYRYKDSNGNALTCYTCHTSPRTDVQDAIRKGDMNCNACHTVAGHDQAHRDTLDSNCLTCHSTYLTQEHLSNKTTEGHGYTCDICHSSTISRVTRTVAANSPNCAGCHKQAHNLNMADSVPADIPLYDGFRWSLPMDASLFAEEPTTPPNFNAGQIVISNHRTDVTASEIAGYYKQVLPTRGWAISTAPPYTATGAASFVYGKREVYVDCTNSQSENDSGPDIGLRIKIWYK